MKITAEQKFIRMSPRKIRLVVSAIKNLAPNLAIEQLDFMTKRAAEPVSKVLKQAVANATNNFRISPQALKIDEIMVNEGPTHKRWQAVSRGRSHSVLKRTSHIKVILETIAPKVATVPAKQTEKKAAVPVVAAKKKAAKTAKNGKKSKKSDTSKKE